MRADGLQVCLVARHEGRPLLVVEDNARATAPRVVVAIDGLEDPKQGEEGEGEGGPVDERVVLVYIQVWASVSVRELGDGRAENVRQKMANKLQAMAMRMARKSGRS